MAACFRVTEKAPKADIVLSGSMSRRTAHKRDIMPFSSGISLSVTGFGKVLLEKYMLPVEVAMRTILESVRRPEATSIFATIRLCRVVKAPSALSRDAAFASIIVTMLTATRIATRGHNTQQRREKLYTRPL
ncbi:hypothetical protein DQ04_19311000 [Trypanosoma grayi]|uniref:hypothetical protein n=1 Tax=Trypanosoma grayi TaxID=71804 RepID=UPI0004F4B588|nr:hypothetical protein DQ04_19311000 [Trypanosoma grayi]KEG05688.1 hypothetical protein DQ04_19311000 [Trypanosoma grayi]